MGKYLIELTDIAKKHLQEHKKSGNKATMTKIKNILLELAIHPYTGTGKPEQLKHELLGFWSRRINQKDRIIYRVLENVVTVEIVPVMGHYGDK